METGILFVGNLDTKLVESGWLKHCTSSFFLKRITITIDWPPIDFYHIRNKIDRQITTLQFILLDYLYFIQNLKFTVSKIDLLMSFVTTYVFFT